MKVLVTGLLLAWLVAPMQAASTLQPMPFPDKSCAPVGGLSFVCGPQRAEDAIAIPDTRWLLISGMTPGSGLGVIDTNAKIAYNLYTAKTAKALDRHYPGCSVPPDPASFATHGLSLRAATDDEEKNRLNDYQRQAHAATSTIEEVLSLKDRNLE